jgi:toxin ParE1/3/4
MAYIVGSKVEDELDEIWLYIAAETSSLDIANRFVDSITEQFSFLSRHPYMGRKRDDLAAGLRSIAVGSYVIVYRAEGGDVRILHVVHGRRDLRDMFRR